jgi:hypothetical protein
MQSKKGPLANKNLVTQLCYLIPSTKQPFVPSSIYSALPYSNSWKRCISSYEKTDSSPSFLGDPGCICQGWQTPPPSSPRCPQHMLPPPASELQLSAAWRRCCCLPLANWPVHLSQAGSSYCDVDESVMQGPMSEPVFFLRSRHTPQIHEPL